MAATQEEADKMVTDKCDCAESDMVIYHQKMLDNLEEVAGAGCAQYGFIPTDEEDLNMIHEVAELIFKEKIDKVTFMIDATTLTITNTAKGVKINRKKIKSVTLGG